MFVLFTHVPQTVVGLYVDATTPHAAIRLPLLGNKYTEWAKTHSLRDVLAENGWKGEPVVLVGWSAGCFPIRQWLRDAGNRSLVAGAVLLDGLHTSGPPCQLDGVTPLVEFARTGKPLAVTASLIVPGSYASTKDCLDLLRASLPAGANVQLLQASDSDHVAQVRVVGPPLLRWVLEHLGPTTYVGSPASPMLGVALLLGLSAAVSWWLHRRSFR